MRTKFISARSMVLLLGACLALSVGLHGDSNPASRMQRLNDQLICTCGCMESPMACHTLGCTTKLQMLAELRQRSASSDSDSLILQSFVQEYGTQVIANPTTTGFNLLAWVMPWIMVGLGLALVFVFVRHWRRDAAAPAPAGPALDAKVQAEIAAELGEMKDWER